MPPVILYGTPDSRAVRVLWALMELGVDYKNVPWDFRTGETNTPEYLAMNPIPTVPTLKDGDFVIHESCAITLYLARKYPGGNLPALDERQMALATQWSLWSMWNFERHTAPVRQHFATHDEGDRDPRVLEQALQALHRPLKAIDGVFAERPYLLGSTFSIADLNMTGLARPMLVVNIDVSAYPHFKRWLDTCRARPAQMAAEKMLFDVERARLRANA
jgi:glutathione S-transferase